MIDWWPLPTSKAAALNLFEMLVNTGNLFSCPELVLPQWQPTLTLLNLEISASAAT